MRKMKYVIGILLLFLVVGFATVSVSLSIAGNAKLVTDIGNFKVYFSDVKLNDNQNLTLVRSETKLEFDVKLYEIGSSKKISYDVTNASKVFDASLNVNCTNGNDILSVVNEFDSSNLSALSTRSGSLTLTKIKSNSNETNTTFSITCEIVANPIERTSEGSGDVVAPVQPVNLSVGDIVSIEGENFNIISQDEDTVTMLAQKRLNTNYRQGDEENIMIFADSAGWVNSPGPKEIDIQTWSYDYTYKYVSNYVSYLNTLTGSTDIEGDLITLSQLKNLGCYITDNYSDDGTLNCKNTYSWLTAVDSWWTKSADSNSSDYVWWVSYDYVVSYYSYGSPSSTYGQNGVRPVITISKDLARRYVLKNYNIGDEIIIGSENFNVMSDNGTSLTLLSKYNLGTSYRQSKTTNSVKLFSESGWSYTPGPKEIDIQAYEGNAKTYVNEYVSYLKEVTRDDSITGNIFTLADLKPLGCTFPENYTFADDSSVETCANSPYKSWLINGQKTWTRSAEPSNSSYVWMFGADGVLTRGTYHNYLSIRPMITISKSALE